MMLNVNFTQDFVVREANVEDAFGIATVHVRTWQCAYRGQMPDSILDSLSVEKRSIGWAKKLANPDQGTHSYIALSDGVVVGWCTGGVSRDKDITADTGELYGIYVDPDYIGRGVGSILMEKMLHVLNVDGYKKATLWVLDTNVKTRKFYEKKGWVLQGAVKVDQRDGFDLNESRYEIKLGN